MGKLTIAVVYGGKSVEHEVSVHSAADVCGILSKKYNVINIFISKEGLWFAQEKCGPAQPSDINVTPVFSNDCMFQTADGGTISADVLFPVLHGTKGEDGCIQGLFELMETPYVGCGVMASAIGMDKEVSKVLAAYAGVPTLPYITFKKGDSVTKDFKAKTAKLGYPVFVKPVNLGSSIGITKVKEEAFLEKAIEFALKFDNDILIEKGVQSPKEIFCAVCGEGNNTESSSCGELIPNGHEFFDYHSKYIDPNGCTVKVPASVSEEEDKLMQKYSRMIFKVFKACGFARVDFLLGKDGQIYFSEINTLPGMSNASLFPQLWRAAGKKYEDVLDTLINLALKRREQIKTLKTDKE
ncbi:D-Alanine/D-alanine ligase [Elusimicrobium minutum Pei191]|uniref:D-alanine--D-alanine ligase n=1 Tax=Elusimicrobium minutum (strain Pei191) TaxID=445932 RepID=B2KDP6_ELUMP|nr:D-alanine--D-alanine ligase family protein [Elusimicrobium minutum]ACC98642.1 D-Alanine/D-alanine ligase [Elusimicrobium minutum Pei191]